MPVPVGLAAVGVAKKAPKPSADNAGMYLLGGLALVWLFKEGIVDPLRNVFNFVEDAAKKTVYVADQLTGGIQGDPRTLEYWTEVDVPFSDTQIPLVNVREENQSWLDYTTTFDFPGLPEYNVLDTPVNVKEEDQSWLDYTTTFDFPGLPEYNVLDTPGKLGGLFRKVI